MFYIYLRVNGIKRLIDLAYVHLGVPLLEPVREVIAKFILSPLRRKIMITATLVVIGLFFLVIFHLWMLMSILLSVLIILAFSVIFYLGVRPIYRFQYWRAHRDRLLEFRPGSYVISIDNLGLSPQELINLREQVGVHREIIIADIDQDGYLLSQFGPFGGAQTILAKDFISRKRNDLQVVAVGENVGVKKTFTNNRKGFLSELEVLNTLWGRSNVPAILNLDFDNLSIVFSF